jgi:hypothetical protein
VTSWKELPYGPRETGRTEITKDTGSLYLNKNKKNEGSVRTKQELVQT